MKRSDYPYPLLLPRMLIWILFPMILWSFSRKCERIDTLISATKVTPKLRMEIPGNFHGFYFAISRG